MAFDPRAAYQDIATAQRYDHERFSSLPGRVFQRAERYALQRIVRRIPRGAVVLDAPCGTGRLLPIFVRRGLIPIAGDISDAMLTVARQRMAAWDSHTRFSRMDLIQIPLAKESVDAVFSIRFLPHIPPEERVVMLREFCRVTRRWVVLSLGVSTPWHRIRRRIKAVLGHQKPVRHPATNRAIGSELRRAGLCEVKRLWTFPLVSEQILLVCQKTRADVGSESQDI